KSTLASVAGISQPEAFSLPLKCGLESALSSRSASPLSLSNSTKRTLVFGSFSAREISPFRSVAIAPPCFGCVRRSQSFGDDLSRVVDADGAADRACQRARAGQHLQPVDLRRRRQRRRPLPTGVGQAGLR